MSCICMPFSATSLSGGDDEPVPLSVAYYFFSPALIMNGAQCAEQNAV